MVKCKEGEVPPQNLFRERMVGVNAQGLRADGRPGAVSLNESVGETGYARYSSVKCPVSPEIQVVPRKCDFRPEQKCSGRFLFSK